MKTYRESFGVGVALRLDNGEAVLVTDDAGDSDREPSSRESADAERFGCWEMATFLYLSARPSMAVVEVEPLATMVPWPLSTMALCGG